MTALRDISVMWSLCHVLVLFILLYRSRYPRKKTIILTGIFMGPLALLHMAGMIFIGPEFVGQIFLVTCTLPSLAFFWFMSMDKKGQFFFTFCLADTVSYWVILATKLVDFYFGGERYILMFIGRLMLFPLLEWMVFRYLKKPYRELQESSMKGWGLFAITTACYYLLLVSFTNYPSDITQRPQELVSFLIVMALMPMTYATIFVAMYRQFLFFRKLNRPCGNRGEMREWHGLHRGGQFWRCLQTAELFSREQLNLWLRSAYLLAGKKRKKTRGSIPLALLLYISQKIKYKSLFHYGNNHILESIPHFRMTD